MSQAVAQLEAEVAEIYAENQALNKQQIALNDEARPLQTSSTRNHCA